MAVDDDNADDMNREFGGEADENGDEDDLQGNLNETADEEGEKMVVDEEEMRGPKELDDLELELGSEAQEEHDSDRDTSDTDSLAGGAQSDENVLRGAREEEDVQGEAEEPEPTEDEIAALEAHLAELGAEATTLHFQAGPFASRDAWTDLLTLLRTYTFHNADLSDMSEYRMVRAIRHLTGFRTVEVGKCPKGCVSYGAKRLEDLEKCPTPRCRENRFTLGEKGEKFERSTQRFYDPAPFFEALRAHPVIGPTLANAKPSDEVVDLHKASGGSGSYPVVRRWVDGLHARTLYANGDLKPDDIPLATFSDGTEVLAHSNANHKVNAHISGVIPMTLPPELRWKLSSHFVISGNGPQKPKDEQ
ncbi:hypothetical protein MVLG_03199 [Microbotryum lychnidis-dioicae p1A1 Lamole]|uniref:Uncharacterized protein n=1 Tax=Microbotryum lychnidis-dioicae (strain p1A1 Lamole / MvSl-1064) TaxID=683840 RepID=U5H7G8_USTV1|nr:hypothetical protein MVLG_03199 [Microbotryum lychnidis-dioicae p1A1 Lamole]|eukprot:KDE06552.1 hypothetical protein MVLG_03199 [Microbotryum lychnidis-dioicae p1A1 Lamole]